MTVREEDEVGSERYCEKTVKKWISLRKGIYVKKIWRLVDKDAEEGRLSEG